MKKSVKQPPKSLPPSTRPLSSHSLNSAQFGTRHRLLTTTANPAPTPLHGNSGIEARFQPAQTDDKFEQEADEIADQVVKPLKSGAWKNGFSFSRTPITSRTRHGLAPAVQTKMSSGEKSGPAVEIPSRFNDLTGGGRPLSPATSSFMESRFNRDFSNVRIHTDSRAASLARSINAKAFTIGNDIGFNTGEFKPSTDSGKKLLAHELVHTIQQSNGRRSIQRKVDCSSTYTEAKASTAVTERYALVGLGEVIPWSAAMHPAPPKFKKEPHDNTCSDVRRGTKLVILGHNSNWLYVHTMGISGFVSKELIKFDIAPEVSTPSFPESLKRLHKQAKAGFRVRTFVETERDAIMIKVVENHPKWNLSVSKSNLNIVFKKRKDAFLIVKKAENKPTKLTAVEQVLVEVGVTQLKRAGKYNIDPATKKVTFKTKAGAKININSIEDFILFVEKVEDSYPAASVEDIVSEIRQMWFSDTNWEILVDSRGISDSSGKYVDIETEPNPIAVMFNMTDLAPAGKEKNLSSPLGTITISHVIAGIDAYLSGAPSLQRARSHVKSKGKDTGDVDLKHKTLTKQHGGDPTDFTTWSGDLGQGYAEYLVAKYVKGKKSANLKTFMDNKASTAQLLADIHGYIAVKVWKEIPESETPSTAKKKLSNILRDLYLVDKKGVANISHKTQIPRSYLAYFEDAAGKKGAALHGYIKDRSLKFGSPWYAKKAADHNDWLGSEGWTKSGILANYMAEFDKNHKSNDSSATANDKLDFYVNKLLNMLSTNMP